MNIWQRIILSIGTLSFALNGLFPPWIRKREYHTDIERIVIDRVGRRSFFDPPKSGDLYTDTITVFIDLQELLIIWTVILIFTVVFFYVFKSSGKN